MKYLLTKGSQDFIPAKFFETTKFTQDLQSEKKHKIHHLMKTTYEFYSKESETSYKELKRSQASKISDKDERYNMHKELSQYRDEPFNSRDEFELKRARKTLTD